jgi:hypothetical protein
MIGGKRRTGRSPVADSKARFAADIEHLPAAAKDIRSPKPPVARMTPALRALTSATRRRLVAGLKER